MLFARTGGFHGRRIPHARFWAILVILVLAVAVLGVTVWGEITKLFGL